MISNIGSHLGVVYYFLQQDKENKVNLLSLPPVTASAAVFCTQPHVNSFSKKRNSVPTDLQSRQYCYLRIQRTYRYLVAGGTTGHLR